jgi:putative ABC transport system substrate-binding protein
MRRVGVMIPFAETEPQGRARLAALQEGLKLLGWFDGRNLHVDVRWSRNDRELDRKSLAELVALGPAVMVMPSPQASRRLHAINPGIPIVVANATDLVETGLANNLAAPGGFVTGFTLPEFSIGGKWLELLKAVAPGTARVLNIYHPEQAGFLPAVESAAAAFGMQVQRAPVRNATEIKTAIDAFATGPNGGLVVHVHPVTGVNSALIVTLAAKHALPAVYPSRGFIERGGLICYGINGAERWRSAATYVDLILRGARPADLPIQSATKIELVINLRTAKALGLTVPPRLIAGADEVIE